MAKRNSGTAIERTTAGLREALFSTAEKLIDGQITAAEAHAVANLAITVVKSAELDLECKKLAMRVGLDDVQLPKLLLTEGK